MRPYDVHDIKAMFERYESHFTHVIVAHTYHRPYVACSSNGSLTNVKPKTYINTKLQQTSNDCRYALNCFYKLLYPGATNRPVRRPNLYRPLTFVTIENAKETLDRAQTIHVNITLGNLPTILTTDDIETLFRHAWHDKAHQAPDVKAIHYYRTGSESRWLGYVLKEAQRRPERAWNTNSIWDVTNCWIPHDALNAD